MGWVYRRVDQHECAKPKLYSHDRDRIQISDIYVGDVWQCDHPECGTYWIVLSDQRDGLYWSAANSQQIDNALNKVSKKS
jgi:hypothetical protein